MTDRSTRPGARLRSSQAFWLAAAALVTFQLLLGLWGSADYFTRGHNGFNSSAYLLSARNSLRWGELFPHQYYTEPTPPEKTAAYTHAPLGLHLSNVAAVWLLGDRPLAVRGVAALYGALVVLALLYVVAQHWSRKHALWAAAVYIALPINAIFGNMVNHTGGFLLWSLGMLHCYLRYRQSARGAYLAGLLFCSYWATFWDWPAYYVAFFIAVHWFVSELTARLRGQASQRLWRFLGPFAGFCAFILLTIAGFLAIIFLAIGSVDDLLGTYQARQVTNPDSFWRAVRQVPKLMFSYPVLLVCALWLGDWLVRLLRGRAEARDLIPISYGVAGVLHFFIFRSSSVVHEYWLWPVLPFVGIALADVAVRGGQLAQGLTQRPAGRVLRPLVSTVALLPCLYLFVHSAQITPAGRAVGGSMWFVTTVRSDHPEFFDSGRPELRFAAKVRDWTDRSTAVIVHHSLERFRPEPRFDVTLDRALRRSYATRPAPVPPGQGISGSVFIGSLASYPLPTLLELAAQHRVIIYDHYFMVDLRNKKPSLHVYALQPAPPSLAYRFWHSPFEPELSAVRDRAYEAELLAQVPARGVRPAAEPTSDSPRALERD